MSECVVRMKTPSSCYVCPLRIACVLYKKWLANEADMPFVYDDGCLIICQLPEGHGRLVDAEELFYDMFVVEDGRVVPNYDCNNFPISMPVKHVKQCILETPTIVPAERSEE